MVVELRFMLRQGSGVVVGLWGTGGTVELGGGSAGGSLGWNQIFVASNLSGFLFPPLQYCIEPTKFRKCPVCKRG